MYYNQKRLDDRAIDELVGISRGVIADKIVNHDEAKYLKSWMEANVPCSDDAMVNQLYRRVHEMLIDGILDDEEQHELLGLLRSLTGDNSAAQVAANMATSLPVDDPAPDVIFHEKLFCLTGIFAYGPRKACKKETIERGGRVSKTVTNGLDYLVIGYLGNPQWIHSAYGRKIEKAMNNRKKYGTVAIISEDHWANAAFKM